ncbi:MAG: hypothetical protein ACI4S3_01865 [Candidatus Gastranaerophilaceae bacterium]
MFNVGFRPVSFKQNTNNKPKSIYGLNVPDDFLDKLIESKNTTPQPLAGSIVYPKPPTTFPPREPLSQPLAGLIAPPKYPTQVPNYNIPQPTAGIIAPPSPKTPEKQLPKVHAGIVAPPEKPDVDKK